MNKMNKYEIKKINQIKIKETIVKWFMTKKENLIIINIKLIKVMKNHMIENIENIIANREVHLRTQEENVISAVVQIVEVKVLKETSQRAKV